MERFGFCTNVILRCRALWSDLGTLSPIEFAEMSPASVEDLFRCHNEDHESQSSVDNLGLLFLSDTARK